MILVMRLRDPLPIGRGIAGSDKLVRNFSLKITRAVHVADHETSGRQVTRSLKTENSPILDGMQIFHNYLRPNQGIDNHTPSELAGIEVNGDNKWLTLIQNASRKSSDLEHAVSP